MGTTEKPFKSFCLIASKSHYVPCGGSFCCSFAASLCNESLSAGPGKKGTKNVYRADERDREDGAGRWGTGE